MNPRLGGTTPPSTFQDPLQTSADGRSQDPLRRADLRTIRAVDEASAPQEVEAVVRLRPCRVESRRPTSSELKVRVSAETESSLSQQAERVGSNSREYCRPKKNNRIPISL